jgi:trimeric autotransporter adhesin
MKSKFVVILSVTLIALTGLIGLTQAQAGELPSSTAPQIGVGTGFTYQGQLKKNGSPVNNTCDFRFILYTADIGGSQVGPTQNKNSVSVSNGLFTVNLDFGDGAFTGDARWLDIAVRCPAGSGTYSALTPRQAVTPAPYALALPGLWTQPNSTSPNIIGGRFNNTVTVGVYGATIGGGGAATDEDFGFPVPNRVTDHYGTIGGGIGNQAGNSTGPLTDTMYATVGGGRVNVASGWESVVAGGAWNTASGTYATVAGGAGNTANLTRTTVCGGMNNTASGENATIGGGIGNTANDEDATVGGGRGNTASYGGTVAGGGDNVAGGQHTFIGGGDGNTASGNIAVIGGGKLNNSSDGTGITVGGGYSNTAHGDFTTIGGGSQNIATDNIATIAGGYSNTVTSYLATIGGGEENLASGPHAFVGGGYQNIADQGSAVAGGTNNMAGPGKSFIGAGGGNVASGDHAVIGGGAGNVTNGSRATVPGGERNTAQGDYSLAAGYRAKANHSGAFVWGDSTDADIDSSGNNQFIVRANGGVWFGRATNNFTPTIGANVFISTSTGAYLSNGGAWTNSSDRNAKENWVLVDGREVLARLAAVPIATWNYKAQNSSVQHIGPAAQDFHAAFDVGEDNAHISTIDADGVALAAIQGLNQIVQEKEAQIVALEARVSALEQRLGARPTDYMPYAIVGGLLVIGLLITRRRRAGGAA